MSWVLPSSEGAVIMVRALPGARKTRFFQNEQGILTIAVTAVAEKGKANQAIIEVLCKSLRLRKSQVELLAGQTARQKKVLVRGASAEQLEQRITEFFGKAAK